MTDIITRAQAQEHLDAWLEAELKVSRGQEYQIGDRRMRRADLPYIAERINFWRAEVNRLALPVGNPARTRGPRAFRIITRDS